jgi:hypothetical protein
MDLPLPLGRLAQIAVIAVFVITAAAQIAIPTIVLMVPVGLALATVGAAFALAFGLGGRDIATALSTGRSPAWSPSIPASKTEPDTAR